MKGWKMKGWKNRKLLVVLFIALGLGGFGLRMGPVAWGLATKDAAPPEDPRIRIQQKMDQVQQLVPQWVAAGGNHDTIAPLGQQVDGYMKAGRPKEAEEVLDQILAIVKGQKISSQVAKRSRVVDSGLIFSIGNLSFPLLLTAWDHPVSHALSRMAYKLGEFDELSAKWTASSADPKKGKMQSLHQKLTEYMAAGNYTEAEKVLDEMLLIITDSRFQFARTSAHKKELQSFLATARKVGAGVEDYIGWAVVEPKEGQRN